jgi:hypothetical protein
MSGDMSTQLDRPYAQQPATRQAAVRYIERKGYGDLLAMLGLVDDPEPVIIDGRACCPTCEQPLPGDGRRLCRRPTCPAGPKSREATT